MCQMACDDHDFDDNDNSNEWSKNVDKRPHCCRVTYLQFPIQACFFPLRSARWHSDVLGIPDIRHQMSPQNLRRFLVRIVQAKGMILN